jgi:DNA polymerase-1
MKVIRDAAGRPVALDIETAPLAAEADRLKALLIEQAEAQGRLKAAKKAGTAPGEIARLTTETRLLGARVEYARSAALDPLRSRIRLVQLYGGGGRVAVIDVFRTGEQILGLLSGVNVVIHNAAFELMQLEARGVELGEVHCTMQAARLTLGEGAMRLEVVAKAYLDVELDKSAQASDWATPHPTRQQLQYAADDAVAAWGVAERIFPSLGVQTPAYEIQIAATPAAARIRQRGFKLDLEAHAGLMASLKAERVVVCEAYRSACADAGRPDLAAKVPSTPEEKRAVLEAFLTGEELARWRRTPRSDALSTARSELRRATRYPPIRTLVELSRIDKITSAFGPTLTALISPTTGRIHADYLVAGTASGRASCSRPNLQQAPRDKSFRALFKAAAGYQLVAADYGAMELRAVAHISQDRRMTEAFRNGEDLHRLTAAAISGKRPEDVTDEERRAAKPVNFGAVYGMGAAGLVATAWDQYELVISFFEAREWLAAFARSYPDLAHWRRVNADLCAAQGRIVIGKDAGKGVGRVYPFSRLPPGKSPYTVSCNLPVQGICADASMLALTAIDRMLEHKGIDGGPVAWLHDEIILEVKAEDAPEAARLLGSAMTWAFRETFPGAPLNGLVKPHVASNWGEAKG